MHFTRVFLRRPDLNGLSHANVRTQLQGAAPTPGGFDAEALFKDHFGAIRAALARHPRQGMLIAAFDERPEPIGELWLEASLDRSRAAIVGRHGLCDLLVPPEQLGISLRHLAIIVRAIDLERVRVRVLDLLTGRSFQDEAGRELRAVTCDGPLFLRLGPVKLILLPTPEIGGLPEDPAAAYRCLPARVFTGEIEGHAEPPARRPILALRRADGETLVRAHPGPLLAARDLCGDSEEPTATLLLRGAGSAGRWPISRAALERGILIGRYERCQIGAEDPDSGLSRVHLLLVADGDRVLAIDTASTNGTRIRDREKRLFQLEAGDVLDLGGEMELVWSPD